MKYRFALLEEGETPADLIIRILFATDDVKMLNAAETALRGAATSCANAIGPLAETRGNRKEVFVMGTTDACELPTQLDVGLRFGHIFKSAASASRELGYQYNAVALELAKARRNGTEEVTLKGVTLTYLDNYIKHCHVD